MDSKGFKHCSKCGRDLPVDAFNVRLKSKDGLQAWCRECMHERRRWAKAQETPKIQTCRACGREFEWSVHHHDYCSDYCAAVGVSEAKSRYRRRRILRELKR